MRAFPVYTTQSWLYLISSSATGIAVYRVAVSEHFLISHISIELQRFDDDAGRRDGTCTDGVTKARTPSGGHNVVSRVLSTTKCVYDDDNTSLIHAINDDD